VQAVLSAMDPAIEVGVHLHARPGEAAEKIAAAYGAGCRRIDMAIGGFGGCPFAQDTLVGNIPTEIALAELERLGATLPRLQPLADLHAAAAEIERRFGSTVQ
ncbi:MAG: hydroxymethylglutaryl-CoA lyase, partial [Acidobacteriaceae bacterium]